MQSRKHQQKRPRGNMKKTQQMFQNEAELDTPNHQKSMPKQVAKQIMNIMNNHVFLTCKNMQIQFENYCF